MRILRSISNIRKVDSMFAVAVVLAILVPDRVQE